MTGVYGGVAASERRSVRRERLLEAALDLLGSRGWQATTVRAICARARLTPRYFYESFTDREALLVALFDQVAAEAAAAVLRAVGSAPHEARAKARAAIGAFVELVTDDPRKARVLFVEAVGSEQLARRRFQTLRTFAGLVTREGGKFYGLGELADPLGQTAGLMAAGGLAETLLAWLDGSPRMSREALIDDCTDVFVALGESTAGLIRQRAGLASTASQMQAPA